jgi:hypothetical protein
MCRLVAPICAALALLTASACSSYRSTESETLARFLPKENALLVFELEHGIQSEVDGPAAVEIAVGALRRAGNGARIYPPGGGLITLDFDEDGEAESMEAERAAAFREFAHSVHVVDRGLFVDGQGRLSFFRLTRLERFDRLLELVNEWINREENGREMDARPFRPEFPVFDEASWKLVRAAVGSGHAWLAVDADAIVLDIPMTEANAAQCLAEVVSESRKADDPTPLQFFEQLSGIAVGAGRARLRFCGEPKPVLRFTSRAQDQDYDDAVQRRLVELGVELGGPDASARARAQVEGAEPVRPK